MDRSPQSIFAQFEALPPAGPGVRECGGCIRAATPGDLEAAAAIAAERVGGPADQHRRSMERFVESDTSHLMVAELQGGIVGFGKIACLAHDPGPDTVPEGWYLGGVIVRPSFRRRGVGRALTSERIEWLRAKTNVVHYFVNAQNEVSIALHRPFGFVEVARNIVVPGVSFTGGVGLLFRLDLTVKAPLSS